MTSTEISMYLLEGVLDHGLSFVAVHLKKILNKSIIIIDNCGHIHYPYNENDNYLITDQVIAIAEGLTENEYHFCEIREKLIYQVGQNNARAYIIVEDIPKNQVLQAITAFKEAKLAIKNYFINAHKVRKNTEKFEEKFVQELLVKSNLNIRDILKINKIELDMDKPYFIKLIQIEAAENKVDLRLMRTHVLEYVKNRKLAIVSPVIWGDDLMLIIPALYKEDTLEIDPEWPKLIDSTIWKEAADKKFNINVAIGLGQVYTLEDLHRSYNEARIALVLPRLLGKKGTVQRFCDLGQFSHIFSQDIKFLKSYCRKSLGALIEYDNKSEAELLSTLRILLDKCCNWKETAASMFIHVNTLHYRVDKIEQLLDVHLTNMNTRANLFTAIKVLDTLRALGFLDNLPQKNYDNQYSREKALKSKSCEKAI